MFALNLFASRRWAVAVCRESISSCLAVTGMHGMSDGHLISRTACLRFLRPEMCTMPAVFPTQEAGLIDGIEDNSTKTTDCPILHQEERRAEMTGSGRFKLLRKRGSKGGVAASA